MRRLLTAECRKLKGRYFLLTVFSITAAELLWILGGKMSEDAIRKGWMSQLFQMPLINALFLPIMAVVVSSRLCDLERKNNMLKELCCIEKRGKLYDAKLIVGGAAILLSIIIQFIGSILYGFWKHFGGSFLYKEYALLFLFTVVPTGILYILQYSIALCSKKPITSFLVGILGEFAGVFSMFLPQMPMLRRLIPWGYYGVLMFVGLDYDRTTRIANYYFLDIDWIWFGIMIGAGILLYFIGKQLFYRIEFG